MIEKEELKGAMNIICSLSGALAFNSLEQDYVRVYACVCVCSWVFLLILGPEAASVFSGTQSQWLTAIMNGRQDDLVATDPSYI